MNTRDAFIKMSSGYAAGLVLRVLSLDNMHLSPRSMTRAAAVRFRAGLRALEAYLRRLILCLALQLEHDLPRTNAERARLMPGQRPPRKTPRKPSFHFTIFTGQYDFPDAFGAEWVGQRAARPAQVPAAPLLARLSALSDLAKSPMARARRLAWHMARHKAGLILAPDLYRGYVPRRYGTEVSATYDAMGHDIIARSRARPPPLGPVPRPPPRIRCL